MIKIAKHYSEVWDKFVPKEKFVLVYIEDIQTEAWRYQTIKKLRFGTSSTEENNKGEVYYD